MIVLMFAVVLVLSSYLMLLEAESQSNPAQINWQGIYSLKPGYTIEMDHTACGRLLLYLDSTYEHASFEVKMLRSGGLVHLKIKPRQAPHVNYGYGQKGIHVSAEFLRVCHGLQNTRAINGQKLLTQNATV